MSRPPLHALQGFVAAARSGNLSRAAESMHLTVSALSHQIRGLEERLGQRLFVRNARGVELTARRPARCSTASPPHLDEIEHALRPFRARRDDVLTITLMPSFASSWLVPRLPRFLAAHPQLEIHLQSTIAVVDFARDTGIDAGLRYGPGQWPGLQAVHLFDDWVTPTASPELIARLGRPTLQTLDAVSAARRARRPLERLVRAVRRHAAEALRRQLRRFRNPASRGGRRPGHRARAGMSLIAADGRGRAAAAAVRRAAEGRVRALPGVSAALGAACRAAGVPRMAAAGSARLRAGRSTLACEGARAGRQAAASHS